MVVEPQGGGVSHKRTILVVDDDGENLDLIVRALRSRHEVMTAAAPPQALALLANQTIDLVIADQRMSPMSGVELLRRVRNQWPTLPVVLMSAYADTNVLVDAINAGVSRFVGKPFKPEELEVVVDSILGTLPTGASRTILVVDDSREIRELLTTALTRAGYVAVCAANADEAIKAMGSHQIDLALVDIALPGASGLELTAALKRAQPTLPVIIVSAVESVDVAIEALRLGVVDYVTKPFRFREILFRVERAFEMALRGQPSQSGAQADAPQTERPLSQVLESTERSYLEELLEVSAGDLAAAARRAGLPRAELKSRLEHHQLGGPVARARGKSK